MHARPNIGCGHAGFNCIVKLVPPRPHAPAERPTGWKADYKIVSLQLHCCCLLLAAAKSKNAKGKKNRIRNKFEKLLTVKSYILLPAVLFNNQSIKPKCDRAAALR